MKKAVSISLVLLLMLNVMGYYGLFVGLKYRNAISVTKRIDARNYDESETVTIRIPLAIPYYGDTEFVRVDGEIEHEGQFYRLIKQKLERDTLHVVCIRDTRAERIHEALTDYVRTFTDQSTDRSNSRTIQSLIKDYFPSCFSLKQSAEGWSMVLCFKAGNDALSDAISPLHAPPPKV